PRPPVPPRRHRAALTHLELAAAGRARAGRGDLSVRRRHQLPRRPHRELPEPVQRLLEPRRLPARSRARSRPRPRGLEARPLSAVFASLLIFGATAAGWGLVYLRRRLAQSDAERRRVTEELNRRLSELFSLQELSFVLSSSLQLERIVDQVVRYAMRFLEAQGAVVAL